MPSACTRSESKASIEASCSVEKCILVVEKKVRNLEKRKGKLDAYRAKRDGGETLNEDQQDAIQKYDAVIQSLDLARDLQKQFQAISTDLEKVLKKKVKREKIERQEQEISQFKELLKLQDLLSNMGCDEVRDHFKQGASGAVKLKESDIDKLDEIYKVITPSREVDQSYYEQLTHASEHIFHILEGKDREVQGMSGTTYKQLKELVDRIHESGYFDKIVDKEEDKITDKEERESIGEKSLPIQELDPSEADQSDSAPETPSPLTAIYETTVHVAEHPVIVSVSTVPASITTIPSEPHMILEDDSFFSTAQYQTPPRAITEIVSSVQGNFNFLQDSEIEDNYALAQVQAQQKAFQNSGRLSDDRTGSPSTYNQQITAQCISDLTGQHGAPQAISQHTDLNSLDFSSAAPTAVDNSSLQFGAVEDLVSGHESMPLSTGSSSQQTALDAGYRETYNQNLMSQTMTVGASSHYVDQSSVGLMNPHISGLQKAADSLGSASTNDVPQPIPLPSETLPGQSLMSPAYNADDANVAAAQQQEKKGYTMNPNADPFQSSHIFNQRNMSSMSGQSVSAGTQSSQHVSSHHSSSASPPPDSTTLLNHDERQKKWEGNVPQQQPQPQDTADYQGGVSSRGGRGTNRGRGSMNNGFSRGAGGRGVSNYGNGRGGNYNNAGRGSGRGGAAWQGYASRGDYRQEGAYQGFNNGYSNSGNQATTSNRLRGGQARGGGIRGSRGISTGFNRSGTSTY